MRWIFVVQFSILAINVYSLYDEVGYRNSYEYILKMRVVDNIKSLELWLNIVFICLGTFDLSLVLFVSRSMRYFIKYCNSKSINNRSKFISEIYYTEETRNKNRDAVVVYENIIFKVMEENISKNSMFLKLLV